MEEKKISEENEEFIRLYEKIVKHYPSNLIIFEKNAGKNEMQFEVKFSNDFAKKEFNIINNDSITKLLEDVLINTDDLLNLDLQQEIPPSLKDTFQFQKRSLFEN